MQNVNRTFAVARMESITALARELKRSTWTLCTGFQYKNLLFLNDSESEDSAQEYAVFNMDTGFKIESITVSWMQEENLISWVVELGNNPEQLNLGRYALKLEYLPEQKHNCLLCE